MNGIGNKEEIKFSRTLLVVDDDAEQCSVVKRLAAVYDVDVQTANSGHSALALIQSDPEKYFLILTDQFMPGMDGDVLLEKVQSQWPHIRRAMISGDETGEAITKAYESGDLFRYIRKTGDEAPIKELIEDACKHALSFDGSTVDIVKNRKILLGELISEVFNGSVYERLYADLDIHMFLHCQKMCEIYKITRLPLIDVEKDAFKREIKLSVKESLKNIRRLLETTEDANKNFTLSAMMKQFNITGLRRIDRSLTYNEAVFAAFISRFISYYELMGLNPKDMITVSRYNPDDPVETRIAITIGGGDRYVYNDLFNPLLSSVYKGVEIACLQLEAVMLAIALRVRGAPVMNKDDMQVMMVI